MSNKQHHGRLISYSGERLRSLSFPLGGIGTGTIALCGDGGLRQWQIFNNINHTAHVPHSFFAVSVLEGGGKPAAFVLQSDDWYGSEFEAAPSVSDHLVPRASRRLLETLPGIHDLEYIGEYPVAEIRYPVPEPPLSLTLQAYSPFVPLDADDSGLPVIIFHFFASNNSSRPMSLSILMSQQNAIGWDDATEIDGITHPSYGGNTNRLFREQGVTAVLMDKINIAKDDGRYGQMLIASLDESASGRAQWISLEELWDDFCSDGLLETFPGGIPSPAGQTVNAALASKVSLHPGENRRMTFLLAWFFPNRYVGWNQPTLESEQNISKSKLWLGNYYGARFASVLEIAKYVCTKLDSFDHIADRFRNAMYHSTLPASILVAVSTQISVIRSPTCFRAADGFFYGFEGCLGASTEMIGERGGCCPLNCTHVWNYAMAVARLFPQLEHSMREIEWLHQQHESGYLPHRVVVPLYLRRPWDRWIGGPAYPALDGLLGAVLKTYREYRAGAGKDWLIPLWEHIRLAMAHVMKRYDRGDGIIRGPQPCTYDVEIEGPNSFITSLYLAALRAAEEMSKAVGDIESRTVYHKRFLLARKSVDRLLWNGEYYIHKHHATESVQSYGNGCHSDQLFGQWWAHALGLGHILPPSHVRSALASIVKYNLRQNLREHQQFPRKYLKDDEAGLLNCSWPDGDRPDTPLLYSDEIWTGIEYEVAGALLYEDMIEEAMAILQAVRKRHDGRFRSPWNEVECGDHYVRAMSSWLLLEAASGFSYDATKGAIAFAPRTKPEKFSAFFAAAGGWGKYSQRITDNDLHARLFVAAGTMRIRDIRLAYRVAKNIVAKKGKKPLIFKSTSKGGEVHIEFPEAIEVNQDEVLGISID